MVKLISNRKKPRLANTLKHRLHTGSHKLFAQYKLFDYTGDEFEPTQKHTANVKNAGTPVTWEKKPPFVSAIVLHEHAERKLIFSRANAKKVNLRKF